MKSKEVKLMFPLDLQYFADGDGNNDDSNNGNGNPNGGNEDQNSGNGNSGERTFTQSEVSNMMTKEKNEGKKSILKILGFKNEEEAKSAIESYNKYMESQKTEAEKAKDELEKISGSVAEQTKRAEDAENKLLCFMNGVNKDSIDDVLALASLKVSDTKSLDKVLEEMKKDAKYASFFENSNGGNNGGTGSQPGHNSAGGNGNNSKGSYGKSLAERNKVTNNAEVKSNFF